MTNSFISLASSYPKMPLNLQHLARNAISNSPDLQEQLSGESSKFFRCYQLPDEVIDWCKQNLDIPNNLLKDDFKIHMLWHDIKIHSDYGRSRALNYVFDSGGNNVFTAWYDDTKTRKLYEEIIPVETWHYLDTKTYHTVLGMDVDKIRVGITITTQRRIMNTPIVIY